MHEVDDELTNSGHIPALDGLRAIAILLVIPHNADIFFESPPWLWPVALIAHGGWVGVQLFFVLSGFLITRSLIQSKHSSDFLKNFYIRRVLRIFPLYFMTLFVSLIVIPHVAEMRPALISSYQHQLWLWIFLSNWTQPFGLDVSGFSHFWSLAIEEQFYLFWPLVVLCCSNRKLLIVSTSLIPIALACRAVVVWMKAPPEMAYMFTVCRMDGLAFGAVTAIVSRLPASSLQFRLPATRTLLVAAILLLGITSFLTHTYAVYDPVTLTLGQTILGLAFSVVLFALVSQPSDNPLSAMLSLPWLGSVGKYSFAMYVLHLPLLTIFGTSIRNLFAFAGNAMPLFYIASVTILSYIAGFISYHLLEKHFLKLKNLFPQKPSALATAEV